MDEHRPKAYLITVLVIDHDDWEASGPGVIADYLTRETGSALKTEAFDVGRWGTDEDPDDHPLNFTSTDALAWLREHGKPIPGDTAARERIARENERVLREAKEREERERVIASLAPGVRKVLGL